MLKNETILQDLKELLQTKYPGKINNIILFGSQISKVAQENSDYDILIILNINFDWRLESDIIDSCYEIDLKYDILTDIKIISKNELLMPKGKQGFIQNALRKGLYA